MRLAICDEKTIGGTTAANGCATRNNAELTNAEISTALSSQTYLLRFRYRFMEVGVNGRNRGPTAETFG